MKQVCGKHRRVTDRKDDKQVYHQNPQLVRVETQKYQWYVWLIFLGASLSLIFLNSKSEPSQREAPAYAMFLRKRPPRR